MKYIKLVRLCTIECTWPLRSPTPLPSNPLIGWILFWNSSLKFSTDSLMFPIDRLRVGPSTRRQFVIPLPTWIAPTTGNKVVSIRRSRGEVCLMSADAVASRAGISCKISDYEKVVGRAKLHNPSVRRRCSCCRLPWSDLSRSSSPRKRNHMDSPQRFFATALPAGIDRTRGRHLRLQQRRLDGHPAGRFGNQRFLQA